MPTKVYTNVATPRLYEEIPDLKRQAIMTAIVANGSIPNNLLAASFNGAFASARNMQRYTKRETYTLGETIVTSSLDELPNEDVWLTRIAATNTPSPEQFFLVDAIDVQEVGLNGLQDYHGDFALQSNPIPDPDVFSRFDYLGSSIDIYKLVGGAGGAEALHQSVPNPVLTHREHYVRYRIMEMINDVATLILLKVDIYNEASNDPAMRALHDNTAYTPPQLVEDVFPVIPIRIDGVDYAADETGLADSVSIKNALRRIKIDPADIVAGMKADPDNPNADDIDDLYLGLGISITETEEWAIAGLAETFRMFHLYNPDTFTTFSETSIRQNVTVRTPQDNGFNCILAYNYITSEFVNTPAANYTKTYTEGGFTEACFPAENPNDPPNCNINTSTNEFVFIVPIYNAFTKEYDSHERITVSGLTAIHSIYVSEFGGDVKAVQFVGNEDELLIPLFTSVVERMPVKFRDDLVFGSMHLYVYSVQFVKLEWYQTGLFKAIIIIIAIVLAYYTGGATIEAGMTFVEAAIAVGGLVVEMILTDVLLSWLVKNVGGEFALILLIAYGIYSGRIDFSKLTTSLNSGWYQLYTAVVQVYGKHVTNELEEISIAASALEADYEKREEEIKVAKEILDYGIDFDFLKATQTRTYPNTTVDEGPQTFYDRTTQTVDLPTISTNLISKYHEAKLSLPIANSYLPSDDFKQET